MATSNKHNNSALFLLCVFGLLLSLATPTSATEPEARFGIGYKELSFVDSTRTIKPSYDFPGSSARRIDVTLWYPADRRIQHTQENVPLATKDQWPLIIYSHGTYGFAKNATHFVHHLVEQGYIVAAPNHPLTSRASFTGIPGPDVSDTSNQPGDVSFVIEQLIKDPFIGKAIDSESIATSGHSLGAVTSYFLNYGRRFLNPKIKAHVLIGGGDPVQAALSSPNMGFTGVQHVPLSKPVLFLSADKDVFANLTGRPFAAYSRVEPPKYEVLIHNGNHIWFRNHSHNMEDGRNPDCRFFDHSMPGVPIPGCKDIVELITEERQRAITRVALLNFFDAYLKNDAKALKSLQSINQEFSEVSLRFNESQ